MQLPLQDFTTLVRNMTAAVQGSCRQLVDLAVGSSLRAVLEANASLALWMQWLLLQVLGTTRAATSAGQDLDSWMADFGVGRLPASPAAGSVVFSRTTPGLAATIPAGAQVRTSDGAGLFGVVADPSHPAWNGAGYTVAAAASSVPVPVVAVVPGAAGNVRPGAIALLASAIPGVDAVTNPAPFTGGLDAESDAALRARFSDFIDSRSRATPTALRYAVASVRQGLRFSLSEGVDTSGEPRPGHFIVTVDDGTGAPSPALMRQVAEAIERVRPLGCSWTLRPPEVLRADVALTLRLAAPATPADVTGPVVSAVADWISRLPIGAPLPVSRVVALVFAAHPAVEDVSGVFVAGAPADLVPPEHGLIRPGRVVVG